MRKIVLGTLFTGLIGILVAGAVIRTMDRVGRVAEAHGHGYGHTYDETDECAEGESGQGHRWGNGEVGGWGNGGHGQVNAGEWLTLQGTVVSVDVDTLVVQTTSSEQVVVENRPWWFAQEQGFSAQVGDQVMLIGLYDSDHPSTGSGHHFEVTRIDDTTSDQTVLIREENGRPLWAGRGRRDG
jgi:hypothetical protein